MRSDLSEKAEVKYIGKGEKIMSFADQLREELAAVAVKKPCCRRALLSGLLAGAERREGKEIFVCYGNGAAATLASELIAGQFAKEPIRERYGRCGHTYHTLTFASPAAAKLVDRLRAEDADAQATLALSCDACTSAFLRGAFLGFGTVNDPHKSFHLEFLMPSGAGAQLLGSFLDGCGYPPRRVTRPRGVGLYYKDSGDVEDLITLMGAHHIVFDVINSRIERDIRNNENRATNCVAKNIEKSISAATRQMEAIDRLMAAGKLDSLPEGVRNTAMLRYRNPDATLDELTSLHSPAISKSGLNHRLQRILEAAEDL